MLGLYPLASSPLASERMLHNGRITNWTLEEKSANGFELTSRKNNAFLLDNDGANTFTLDASKNGFEV